MDNNVNLSNVINCNTNVMFVHFSPVSSQTEEAAEGETLKKYFEDAAINAGDVTLFIFSQAENTHSHLSVLTAVAKPHSCITFYKFMFKPTGHRIFTCC